MWVATDLQLSRKVAVKLLKPTLATDPVVAERFRREAVAVAQLSHPNIVAVYDALEEQGRQAVVMQLVNGKSLRQLLDEQKRLSPDLTMHIGSCVASALDAAHNAGLVHRDVKPGNILITADGRVLLTDFGIAKGLESAPGDDLTSDNIMMGTAKYLSPEQVRGRRLDGRADLYSLGLVLYECLAGRVPFLGQNDADTALARLQRDPTDISRLRPTLPSGLPELVHRLLARKPEQRYASGAAVRAAIVDIQSRPAPILEHTDAAPRQPVDPTPPVRRRPDTPADGSPARGTPPTGVGHPGQPSTVGGYQPAGTRGRPAGPAVVRSDRDRTPAGNVAVQPRPNRQYEQRTGPSLILVGLLLMSALVVAMVLWSNLGSSSGDDSAPVTTTAQVVVDPTPADTTPLDPTQATGPAVVAPVQAVAYDPDGDGIENDEQAAAVIDGNTGTAWSTVCYSDQYLGGKGGVGVVVTLGAPGTGSLEIDIASAPWILEVHASADDEVPGSISSWGGPIANANGREADRVTVPIITDTRHVLVLLRQLGPSDVCSADNPYRGSITEVRFTASGA